jgi:osomolarity two-component system sensor histidine kinase NIK1
MADEEALAAAASIIQTLATGSGLTCSKAIAINTETNGVEELTLPGSHTPAKHALERELTSLAKRVRVLETLATTTDQILPDTPSDSTVTTPFTESTPSRNMAREKLVSSLLASRDDLNTPNYTKLSNEDFEALREHVSDQARQLEAQKLELAALNAQLFEQKQLQERALKAVEVERVNALERELRKHQQANEAFQKALREIGEIVTAVARGDLSKKVQIHSVEMDPEITTFKRTINTMMDQLQVFSSEVSRVAREVGTEGILGGQAQIIGVDGTWKELTRNGK